VLVCAVTGGLAASAASGELAESWLFAVWDVSQAILAAVLVAALRARHRVRTAGDGV
jgi:hypothetical protein